MTQEDDAQAALESVWYEVIEAVMSGRANQLTCPECNAGGLQVETVGGRATVTCPSCRRSVEFVNQSY